MFLFEASLLCASAKPLLDNANTIASVIVETFIVISSHSLRDDSNSLRNDLNRADYLRSASAQPIERK